MFYNDFFHSSPTEDMEEYLYRLWDDDALNMEDANFDTLSGAKKIFSLVWNFDTYVCGGLNNYLDIMGEDKAYECVDSLQIIGAIEASDILLKALKAIAAHGLGRLWDILEIEDVRESLFALDDKLLDCRSDVVKCLFNFLNSRRDELFAKIS